MNLGDAGRQTAADRAALEDEIARLEAKHRQLGQVLGEFEHESRRLRDALERLGGRSPDLEVRVRAFDKNQKTTERDIAETEAALRDLRRRLAILNGAG